MPALIDHTFAANGNTDWFEWDPNENGKGLLAVDGTTNDFGSGTVEVQFSPDETDIVTLTGIELGAADLNAKVFDLPGGNIRLNLSGSTSPDLTVYVFPFRV